MLQTGTPCAQKSPNPATTFATRRHILQHTRCRSAVHHVLRPNPEDDGTSMRAFPTQTQRRTTSSSDHIDTALMQSTDPPSGILARSIQPGPKLLDRSRLWKLQAPFLSSNNKSWRDRLHTPQARHDRAPTQLGTTALHLILTGHLSLAKVVCLRPNMR